MSPPQKRKVIIMIEKGTEKHRGMVRTIVPSIFSERNFIAK